MPICISAIDNALFNFDFESLDKKICGLIDLIALIRAQIENDLIIPSTIPSDQTRDLFSQLIQMLDSLGKLIKLDGNNNSIEAGLALTFGLRQTINCRDIVIYKRTCVVIDQLDNIYTLKDFAVGGKGEYTAIAFGGYKISPIDYICCLQDYFSNLLKYISDVKHVLSRCS